MRISEIDSGRKSNWMRCDLKILSSLENRTEEEPQAFGSEAEMSLNNSILVPKFSVHLAKNQKIVWGKNTMNDLVWICKY